VRGDGTSAQCAAVFTTYHSLASVLLRLVEGRGELEDLVDTTRRRADGPITRYAGVMMPVVLSLGCLERLRIGQPVVSSDLDQCGIRQPAICS